MNMVLNTGNLAHVPGMVRVPEYDRSSVSCSIAHIGVGNFHRGHQAAFCDDLLRAGRTDCAILGISLRSSGMRDELCTQDYLYTLVERDDESHYRVIGSISSILAGKSSARAIIGALESDQTSLITTTVTENGYIVGDGVVRTDDQLFRQDLRSLDEPTTLYGYLAAAIVERSRRRGRPITILSCDNVRNGGGLLRQGTQTLLEQHDVEACRWSDENVAFLSSMVDRVVPATTEHLLDEVSAALGLSDRRPVETEPFRQWVIEDRFAGEKIPFDEVGATFVTNVEPFERIKLAYLNAAHSTISILGQLMGEDYVHDALENKIISRFVRELISSEVRSVCTAPLGFDIDDYVLRCFRRFENAALPYRTAQVCSDSSQKIQFRWFVTIESALKDGHVPRLFAFALGAWVRYIEVSVRRHAIVDVQEAALVKLVNRHGLDTETFVEKALAIAGSAQFEFASNPGFMKLVVDAADDIAEWGVETAAKEQLSDVARQETRGA